jgi:hypothetical protein
MNIGTFIYLFILFVVFTPGILFSISVSSKKWIQASIHGFLFTVVWLLTHTTVSNLWNSNIREGVEGETKIANMDTTTAYTGTVSTATLPNANSDSKKKPKCFTSEGVCVGTMKSKIDPSKTNYYCFGSNTGCTWGSRTCTEDSHCGHFNINNSIKYTDPGQDCDKIKKQAPGHWGSWVCENT